MKKIKSKMSKFIFRLKVYKNYLLFFLVMIFFVSLFFSHKFVTIANIDCATDEGECPVDVLESLEKSEGEKLLLATKQAEDYLDKNNTIKDYALYYKFPNSLKIDIIVKNAQFALKNKNLEWVALVAPDKSVLSITQSTDLPLLITEKPVANLGEKVTDEEFFAMRIIRFLDTYYSFDKAYLKNDKLVVKVRSDLEIVFPTEADEKVLLGGISLILSRLNSWQQNSRIEEGYSYQIDMRYENPIIRKI